MPVIPPDPGKLFTLIDATRERLADLQAALKEQQQRELGAAAAVVGAGLDEVEQQLKQQLEAKS